MGPAPESLPVAEHLAHPVERDAVAQALGVGDLQDAPAVFGKAHLLQRHADDPALNPVQVADLDLALGKTGIPADPAQDVLNWGHGSVRGASGTGAAAGRISGVLCLLR